MYAQQQLIKVWRCIYPVLIYIFIQQTVFTAVPDRLFNGNPVALTTLSAALTIPAALFFYFRDKNKPMVTVLTGKAAGWKYIFIIIMAVGTSITLSFLTTAFSLGEKIDSYHRVNEILFSGHIVTQLVGIGLIVPLAEELIFRGLIQNRIRTYLSSRWKAVAITAVFFGIFHENIVQAIAAAVAGALIGFVYEQYRCFFAPVLFHISFNLPGIIMTYIHFQVDSVQKLVLVAAAGIIIIAVMFFLILRFVQKPSLDN